MFFYYKLECKNFRQRVSVSFTIGLRIESFFLFLFFVK